MDVKNLKIPLFRVFGTLRQTEDFFSHFFLFFGRSSAAQDVFFAVSSCEKVILESYAYPFGYFLAL